MSDRHLTRAEVDAIADELFAAELASKGALPLTPEDEAALEQVRVAVMAEIEKSQRPWWKRWWL